MTEKTFPTTIHETLDLLASGNISAVELLDRCFKRIDDPNGEGGLVFKKLHYESALASAQRIDAMNASGETISPLAGIPISVKDLFDVQGEVTAAGSAVFGDAPAAKFDAPTIARLRHAGAVIVGRTNMSEFAYSGLGINDSFGTPLNPFDRLTGRIPGGSSSGAAISVADGMCMGAIGSDTGGSVRTPAALCGLVGLKPTASKVSLEGVFPLSPSLDSVGPLANSVADCALLYAVLSGTAYEKPPTRPLTDMHFLIPESYLMDDLDTHVAQTFENTLKRLSNAGAVLRTKKVASLKRIATMRKNGGYPAAESYAAFGQTVLNTDRPMDEYVRARILQGAKFSLNKLTELDKERKSFQTEMNHKLSQYDAIIVPTVPCVSPLITEAQSEQNHERLNGHMLRNTAWVNLLDGCAITVPCHNPGTAPVGLMIAQRNDQDKTIISIAKSVEKVISHEVAKLI